MGYQARFAFGSKKLLLSEGRYEVLSGFVPPSTFEYADLSAPTGLSRYSQKVLAKRPAQQELMVPVRIIGASGAEVERAINDLTYMMLQAGDDLQPLMFGWKNTDGIPFEPFWGQSGAFRNVIVYGGSVERSEEIGYGDLRETAERIFLSLQVSAYILGQEQAVLFAQGIVYPDSIGILTGEARGIALSESGAINKVNNPVFGDNSSTWNTGWTAVATLDAIENKQPEFIVFGASSAWLINNEITYRNFTISVTALNTTQHVFQFYAKKEDGGAVDGSMISGTYNSVDRPLTFESVGSGWYRCYAYFNGIASAIALGVTVKTGAALYVDAFMFSDSDLRKIPTIYGDLPGAKWAGTAHNSNSQINIAGIDMRCETRSLMPSGEGTIRIVWESPSPSADLGGFTMVATDGLFSIGWNAGSNRWEMSDFINTITYTPAAFSTSDVFVFHFVYGPSGMAIYIDGAVKQTGSSFEPFRLAGPDITTLAWDGIVSGFTTFATEMDATQVSDDYDQVSQLVADGQRVDYLPFCLGPQPAGAHDGAIYSSAWDYLVINDIPGTAPAETTIVSKISSSKSLLIGSFASKVFPPQEREWFLDLQGTVRSGALNGEIERTSVGTTEVELPAGGGIDLYNVLSELGGKKGYVAVSFYDSTTGGVEARLMARYSTDLDVVSELQALNTSSSEFREFLIGPIFFPELPVINQRDPIVGGAETIELLIGVQRPSGTNNLDLDFYRLLVGDVAYVKRSGSGSMDAIVIENGRAWGYNSGVLIEILDYQGDIIELEPAKWNTLILHRTNLEAVHLYTDGSSIDILITPRYLVM